MTQIFTGEGLGLQGSSLGLGAYGPKGVAALGQGGESVYVNAANGNLVLRQSDGFLADIGFGLDLFQTYNSRGENGSSWCFNLQSRLEINGKVNTVGSSVIRVSEDGHKSTFTFDAKSQAYLPQEGGTARLTFNQNEWVYREGSQKTAFHYSQQGQLTEIRDMDGHSFCFEYQNDRLSTITDNNGKQKIVWAFENGLLQDVTTTSEGQVIHHLHYEYDEQQRLHKVSRDLGQGKTFWITYDYAGDSNRISDIRQSDGTTLHVEYDSQGRVKKLVDGEGRISTYDYQSGKTTVTDGQGESWTYYYDDKNRLTGVDGPDQYRIRYYYEGTLLSSVVQGNQTWKFNYNDEGDCIRVEDPSGQITQRIYDSAHHVISETHYQRFDGSHHPVTPQTTRYIYDERGHLLFTLAADGTVTERRYDDQGQLISTRSYLHSGYDLSTTTEEELISRGALQSWIDKQDPKDVSLIDYRYDWRGQLIEEIHYGQVDATGHGVVVGTLTTRSRFDAAGRLIEKSIPVDGGWSITQYFYDDLGRLIQTLDNKQNSQRIEYDDAHQRVIQTDANGLQTIRTYDHSGLLLSVMCIDGSHNYGTTTYQYDAAGRLVAQTGVDGLSTYTFYDHQGRVQAQVNSSGHLTEYLYSNEGLLLQTREYEQRVSTQGWVEQFPSFTSIKPQSSIHDRITQIVYNQYNQIAFRINSEGAVIAYQYNAQGEVISATAYARRLSNFNPEQLLTFNTIQLVSDTKDRTTYYYYNIQDRLEAQIDGEGFATEYHYDRLGNLIETCRYFNSISNEYSGEWSQDKPIVNTRKDIHTFSLYDNRGLKVADIDGEGYLTEYRYDASGLLQEKCAYEEAISRGIVINEATTVDQIRPHTKNNDHHTTYQYNDLGLLIQEKTQSGLVTTYTYDEIGQLTSKTLADEQTHAVRQQRYRYDALGRVIQTLDELGSALLNKTELSREEIELIWQKHSIRFEYDNSGLLKTKTDALNQTTHYFYDEAKSLRYTVNADGAVLENEYNNFGQVAFTRTYSAFLKTNINSLSTEELEKCLNLLKDDRFDEFTHYEYNTIGQVIAKHSGSRGLVTSSYNSFGELEFSSEFIDNNTKIINTLEYDKRGLLTSRIDDAFGIARNNAIQYNAFGWMVKKIDGRLNQNSYFYNKRGEREIIINASNQYKEIGYDAFGRVLYETSYSHSLSLREYSYDDKNNTLVITNTQEHTKIVTQFNVFGDKVSIQDANGFTTSFQYDEKGQLIRSDAPEQSFNEYHYDESGQLIWQQQAGGQIMEYRYDAAGHCLSKTIDPSGLKLTTSYQYDAIGRQLQITEPDSSIKRFVYDNQGNLIQSQIDPDGLNIVTRLDYDDRGLLIRQIEMNKHGTNKVTAYQWDHLGRKIAVISDPDGLKLTTTYTYDANDNLIRVTDANQHATHYIYDVNNQCRYQINARGAVIEHVYSINGNEIQTVTYAKPVPVSTQYNESSLKSVLKTDPAHDQYQFRMFNSLDQILISYDALGYGTLYHYDGNGNLTYTGRYSKPVSIEDLKSGKRTPPSDENIRHEYFVYNGLNQLRFKCESDGRVTESQYDLNGQLVSSTRYAHPISLNGSSHYTMDTVISSLRHNLQRDQTIRYAYDKAGRVTIELSAEGVAKSYEYDNLGHVIASTLYATKIPVTNVTTLDRLQLIKSTNDRTNHFVYNAAGQELYRISSEGRVLERRYDAVGNVIAELTHTLPVSLSHYTVDGIKNILTVHENQAKVTEYTYDAAGRLVTQLNAQHAAIHYTYDAQGNVLSKIEANHTLWTYQYDEANQLIESRSPITRVAGVSGQEQRSIITRHSYDSFGNLIAVVRDAEGLKQTLLYEFDNNNHKIKTIYPDVKINNASASPSTQRQEVTQTLTEEIKYNAFGEVIATSDKAGNWKHNAFNDWGLLIYSVDSQGTLTQYEYDTFDCVIKKTLYATALQLSPGFDYSLRGISQASQSSNYDRHEFYIYNLDNQVIEVSRDSVRSYNPKTRQYAEQLRPTTKNTYNAFGEVIKSSVKINELEWADTYTYYDKEGHQKAVIDAEGYLTTYHHNIFGDMDSMTEYALVAREWDNEHYTQGQSSDKDRTVTYTYDALGQLTSKTLKQVRYERLKPGTNAYETLVKDLITTYTYDALGHVIATTDAKGNTSYCYYDELGQVIAKIGPSTQQGRGATTYAYDALGHLVETKRWAQGAREADAEHFILNAASGQDILTRQEYDAQDHLISETDGLNHQVFYSYDAKGNLARSWTTLKQINNGPLIQDKRYTYDKENHLLQTATFKNSASLHTEDAQYNAFGEVVAKGINGQYNIHVDYDRCGRVWRSNTQGYYQIFVYDLMDQVTQIVTSTNSFRPEYNQRGVDLSKYTYEELGSYDTDTWRYDFQRQNNVYDALGHLLSQSKEFGADSEKSNDVELKYANQSQTVDRWGNMLSFTNARGFQTHYEYNALNHVIKQELPEVRVVDEHGVARILKPVNSYAYDELGQAIAMIDANGHAVSKEYDALGRVILERDAQGHQRGKHYNVLDQLTESVNELGGVIYYTYDQANRLVAINTPKTHQQYGYDEAGQLIKQTNGAQEETAFWYDALGNQVARSDARGYQTYYEYDDQGHKTREIDSLGHGQSWIYNEQGKLQQHTDLGGHTTGYEYNTNGLLIEERSTTGKHIKYQYQGNGELTQYADEAMNETVNYAYDAEGQLISKESGRGSTNKVGWVREIDQYQYDAQGRLLQVRRRHPEDTDNRFPDKDHALLSIDYEYDAVGNIRHTQVSANYTGYDRVDSEDYYLYDENNRMTVNKGQLINNQIVINQFQGSTSSYDAAGNIRDAAKYENGAIQNYHYEYNNDNQLELIQKNNKKIQSRFYDASGRVIQENGFDANNNLSQKNIMSYDKGLLVAQSTLNSANNEISKINYEHDGVGNLINLRLHVNRDGNTAGYSLNHHYSYALWDSYQQSLDEVVQINDQGGSSSGKSTRFYDLNGQLQDAIDDQSVNTNHYINSTVEGLKSREDKDGKTSYLSVAGKTIGDLRLDKLGKQHLTVYGGFAPTGSQQKPEVDPLTGFMLDHGFKIPTTNDFLGRAAGDIADGTLPEAPQDNLGAYTLQAGDTLESIALHIYGDSSLWYLLADANGISDRNAQAGNGQLHIGQRLNIPPAASDQHHTNGTHKVLNANQMIGNTTASNLSPPSPPPLPKKHNGIFSKIVVAVVAVVATVLTAGALGALAGVSAAGGGLFATGMGILGGSLLSTVTGTLAAGFTAGFVGSIASQGVSKALGLQDGISLKSALISGLATAASGGLLRGLNNNGTYQGFVKSMDKLSISKTFNIANSAQLMEQNAVSQGVNITLQKHQHFDWTQLAVSGITAGFSGSTIGKKLDATLRTVDHNTGILTTELKALTSAGANSVVTGSHFGAAQVLSDNLGDAIGSSIVDSGKKPEQPEILEESPIKGDSLYLTENVLDMIHPERSADALYINYIAKQLNGSGGYEQSQDHLSSEQIQSLDNYESLSFDSDLFTSNINEAENLDYESKLYWNSKCRGSQRVNDSIASLDMMGLNLTSKSIIINQQSSYGYEEALNIHMNLKGSSTPKNEVGKKWVDASKNQVRQAMDIEPLFADPVKKMQFLDLHYQEGLSTQDLDALLKGKGVLAGTGAIFLKASKENNINPLYLVGHALLESGQGESPLAKHNNFFGMGSHDGHAETGGIKFAKEHGWDTPELGIMGAAKIISKQWINRSGNSQSTLYAMRWNPMNPGKNQYATDIHWATSQTKEIYTPVNKMMGINPFYQPKFIVPKYY